MALASRESTARKDFEPLAPQAEAKPRLRLVTANDVSNKFAFEEQYERNTFRDNLDTILISAVVVAGIVAYAVMGVMAIAPGR